MKPITNISTLLLLMASQATTAHVVLDQPRALAGSSYRAVFRVGHGCNGLATAGISVRMPAGVQGAKPMPKPGWVVTTKSEPLATPYTNHGKPVTEEVSEITWTAASKEAAIPDAFYDEFVLRASLPAKTGALWFKVIQSCEEGGKLGRNEWTQVPAEGESTRGLASPAALLVVEAAAPLAAAGLAVPTASPPTPGRAPTGPTFASRAGEIAISRAYALPTLQGIRNGAAYIEQIDNKGKQADRLLRASTVAADKVELHTMSVDANNVMRMRPVPDIALTPGSPVKMQPGGGLHIMLLGLKKPLVEGDRFTLTLEFERSGKTDVTVQVQAPKSGVDEHAEHQH